MLEQLHKLGGGRAEEAAPPPGSHPARKAVVEPSVQEVLTGLGCLVAMQHLPGTGPRLTEWVDPSALQALQHVIEQWLAMRMQSASLEPPENAPTATGFYATASEHLRLLGGNSKLPPTVD